MKSSKLIIIVLLAGGLALLPGRLRSAETTDSGLIGKRYAGADLNWEHFGGSRYDDAQSVAAALNLPVTSDLDATFGYAFAHLMGPARSGLEHSFSASLIAYNHDEYGKPFFAATLGQVMNRTRFQGALTENNDTLWALGAGLESDLGDGTAITYRVDYIDAFTRGPVNPTWRYQVQVTHWVTPRASVILALSYHQVSGAPDSLRYTLGMRFRY